MRIVSMSVAVFVAMSTLQGVQGADNSPAGADVVVVEKVSDRRFRLVNKSADAVLYMKWVNQEDIPVPYCKYADGKVSICARDKYLDANRNPALQEARLEPGKSVGFSAVSSKAVAVGVSLKVQGAQRMVWCGL